jgi:hypothetical protein
VSELDGAPDHDLALLRSYYDVAHAPFTSHRPLLGRFIIPFRNIARELLLQLLLRQSSYNATAARALSRLSLKLEAFAHEQERIARRLDALEVAAGAAGPAATKHRNGLASNGLHDRIEALEDALGRGLPP